MTNASVLITRSGTTTIIAIKRPERRERRRRGHGAGELFDASGLFDADPASPVAVFTGTGDHFCAGADLKAVASEMLQKRRGRSNPRYAGADGAEPPGALKPVIAAIEGFARCRRAGIALWADMRVASETAVFGVFCRRFGVPLIDGGTVRLPRLIGQSRAMDMILTGRPVDARRRWRWGSQNRVVARGHGTRAAAIKLAEDMSVFPQRCLRNDRRSVIAQWTTIWTPRSWTKCAAGSR